MSERKREKGKGRKRLIGPLRSEGREGRKGRLRRHVKGHPPKIASHGLSSRLGHTSAETHSRQATAAARHAMQPAPGSSPCAALPGAQALQSAGDSVIVPRQQRRTAPHRTAPFTPRHPNQLSQWLPLPHSSPSLRLAPGATAPESHALPLECMRGICVCGLPFSTPIREICSLTSSRLGIQVREIWFGSSYGHAQLVPAGGVRGGCEGGFGGAGEGGELGDGVFGGVSEERGGEDVRRCGAEGGGRCVGFAVLGQGQPGGARHETCSCGRQPTWLASCCGKSIAHLWSPIPVWHNQSPCMDPLGL
jgi:hypothetical protein